MRGPLSPPAPGGSTWKFVATSVPSPRASATTKPLPRKPKRGFSVALKVPTGSTYTMDHTALTYLVDPAGKVRVALRHEQSAAEFAADVQRVLNESAA